MLYVEIVKLHVKLYVKLYVEIYIYLKHDIYVFLGVKYIHKSRQK